ncbi:hypothetical protein MNEG_15619, partial [Monoraphidium neglectum]
MSSGDFASGAYQRLQDVDDLEYGPGATASERQAGVASTSAPAPPGSDGSGPAGGFHLHASSRAGTSAAGKGKDRKKKIS